MMPTNVWQWDYERHFQVSLSPWCVTPSTWPLGASPDGLEGPSKEFFSQLPRDTSHLLTKVTLIHRIIEV